MNQMHKFSILSLLAIIALLPVIFLPSALFPTEVVKTSFLAVAVILSLFAVVIGVVREKSLVVPRDYMLWSVLLLPLVYFLSALGSSVPRLSFFGYGFEVGTFGFVLFASILLSLIAIVFKEGSQVFKALSVVFISLSVLAIFALVKIISGGSFPVWNVFAGKLGNPVGIWTDYAAAFGLLAMLSALALGMLKLKKPLHIFVSSIFFLSTILMVVSNFFMAFLVTLILSVVATIYLLTVEASLNERREEGSSTLPKSVRVALWPVVALGVISLMFVINPVVSENQTLRDKVSVAFSVANSDARPSLSATLGISKQVLNEKPLLGSGPNTFSQSWLMHRPKELNSTLFWNAAFPSGIGFLPTQVATVGSLGALVWILFLASFLYLGVKMMKHLPSDPWNRFSTIATFLGALYLWVISFVYTPSVSMAVMAFVLTGLFLASCRIAGAVPLKEVSLGRSAAASFGTALVVVALGVGSLAAGYQVLSRSVSIFHFQKARAMMNVEGTSVSEIESRINRAISVVSQDVYYSVLSELNLAYAQSLIENGQAEGEDGERFRSALQKAISAAQSAVNVNPDSYRNWVALGRIYSSLSPEPFQLEGAGQSARAAFEEARKRNPNSPEIPLLVAILEFESGNTEGARTHINEALSLKQDYADAYYLLAQLEIGDKNIAKAIRSVETSAILAGNNSGLFFQLGLLRYENGDYLEAARALAQALEITPQYANARYFLGLSLDKLGRREEAILTFEDLSRTNPDNEIVMKILENLKAGKNPLDGVDQESQGGQQTATPPISE